MSRASADFARRRLLRTLGAVSGGVVLAGLGGTAQARSQLSAFRLVQQASLTLYVDVDHLSRDLSLFTLDDPHRLVIDLPGTVPGDGLPQGAQWSEGVVKGIRYAMHDDDRLRIVVDLRRQVSPTYQIVPRQGGQRLLVDLGVRGDPARADYASRVEQPAALRDVIVAIDAGHGGKDPGAIGQRKTREKDITLSVARRLYKRLAAMQGVTPVMVRDKDEYVALRQRIRIARARHADVFVSIHADAFKRKSAQGSSVYTLSLKGASSEAAAWLAEKENETDALFGDVALDGLSVDLKQTLLDLAQSSTLESSMDVGEEILARLKGIGKVHKPQVEQAAFAVLKSPDIPSVLVETAFISNLSEEKKLNSPRYQEKLAIAVADGLDAYLRRRAPQGTLLAAARAQRG